jgi:large subunit ribosomal protein L15
MRLHELYPTDGATRPVKRIGRGHGSGQGKTAGKGHKGQKARAGRGMRAGFEGGQMPLQRRLPKRGFVNIFRTEYAIINLATLEQYYEAGQTVTAEDLLAKGLLKKTLAGVKILGDGELTKNLRVTAAKFSATAKEKIEAVGGSAEVA